MNPVKLFDDHPAIVGESYGEHMLHASGFGFRMGAGWPRLNRPRVVGIPVRHSRHPAVYLAAQQDGDQ